MSRRRLFPVAGLLLFGATVLFAFSREERALWIEVREEGGGKTTIAMTERIARQLLESDEVKGHFAKKGGKDLITRDMLRSVLDGDEASIEVQDEDGSEITLHMDGLKVPSPDGRRGKLVLETYKAGSRTLRIGIPDVEIEASDEEEGGFIEMSLGWKGLLPFLAEEGGAIYINNEKDDTQVWVYFE